MKKRGFTLAELLITLVIIGVIAAVALPQFISGMHNQSNASRLSTAITDYENIFGMMMQKENKSNIFETEFGKAWASDDQAGMKTAMAKYTKIARSSNNTSGLGYISYLIKQIIPSAWAASQQQGGVSQQLVVPLQSVPICSAPHPIPVALPEGADITPFNSCLPNYCCEYKGDFGGNKYLCCSVACPDRTPQLVQGHGSNSPRPGCVNTQDQVLGPNGKPFLPKDFWCCPEDELDCSTVNASNYRDCCARETCPSTPPENFVQCSIYKCSLYGLQYDTTCHDGDATCTDSIEHLCRCSKGYKVSETNGPGCEGTVPAQIPPAGGCGATSLPSKPPYYCCPEDTTSCPTERPHASEISFDSGDCKPNTNGSGYCCKYEFPCNDPNKPNLVAPGQNYDGCVVASNAAPYKNWFCCPSRPTCPSNYTFSQTNDPNKQCIPQSGGGFCCSNQNVGCSASNLTGAMAYTNSLIYTHYYPTGGTVQPPYGGLGCVASGVKDYNGGWTRTGQCCKDNISCSGNQELRYIEGPTACTKPDGCSMNTSNCSSSATLKKALYCCNPPVNCDENPCEASCNKPKECCESKGNHWVNNSFCCETTSGHHWSNNTCCDSAHYHHGGCQNCTSGYYHNGGCQDCTSEYYYDGGCQVCPSGKPHSYDDGTCHKCPQGQYEYGFPSSCHKCQQGQYEYDGTCHKCPQNQYEYSDGTCHNCREDEHEVWSLFEGTKCIKCEEGQVWVNNRCETPEDPQVPTIETKPTPFHYVGKIGNNLNATTDDISFGYAETDSQTGANMFYSDIVKYTDASGKPRSAATIYVDVNGKSWPNSFGRDVFALVLDQDGHLYPYGSEKVAQIVSSGNTRSGEQIDNTWKGSTERYGCTKKGTYNGLGCTARLVENHFKVDY